MRRPPPSISSSEAMPRARISFFTSESMWPFWPPNWLCAATLGNFGSRLSALSRSSVVMEPISAMLSRTYS